MWRQGPLWVASILRWGILNFLRMEKLNWSWATKEQAHIFLSSWLWMWCCKCEPPALTSPQSWTGTWNCALKQIPSSQADFFFWEGREEEAVFLQQQKRHGNSLHIGVVRLYWTGAGAWKRWAGHSGFPAIGYQATGKSAWFWPASELQDLEIPALWLIINGQTICCRDF